MKAAAGRIASEVGGAWGIAIVLPPFRIAGSERILVCQGRPSKRVDGRLRFVLGRRIGEVEVVEGITDATVRSAIEYAQQCSGRDPA